MSKLDLSKPQRQSIVGVGVIFFQKLKKAVNVILPIVAVRLGVKTDDASLWFSLSIAIVFIIVLIISYLTYRKFFFYVKGDEFVIEKGLFSREKIAVPFERIQTVNITQNLVQRILRVVGLKVDTAGSADKELEIAALPNSYARSIQAFLIERKDKVEESKETKVEQDHKTEQLSKPLIELNLLDLVKVGLTENHLRTALVLFAIVNGYFWQFQDYLEDYISVFEKYEESWLSYWAILLPIAIIVSFIMIAILSVVQSILRFYGLRLFSSKTGIHLVSGLLKRIEYQIPVNKIQWIKWSTNPLRKMVGYKTIVVKQASSTSVNDKQSIMVPACNEIHLNRLLSDFYPEAESTEFKAYRADAFYQVQLSIFLAVLPSLIIMLIGFYEPVFFFLSALWLIIALPLFIKYASNMYLEVNEELIRLRKGWIFPNVSYLKYYKIQNIRLQQNIFQERRGLAHLVFYTASGSLKMWQLDIRVAQNLYNYILYKIEVSKKNWM